MTDLDRLSQVYDAGYRAGAHFARSGRRIQHDYATADVYIGGWSRGLNDALVQEAAVSAALRLCNRRNKSTAQAGPVATINTGRKRS